MSIEEIKEKILALYKDYIPFESFNHSDTIKLKKQQMSKRAKKRGQILTPKEIAAKYGISYYLFRNFMCRTEIVDFIVAESNKGIPTLLYDNKYLELELRMYFNRKKINVK